MAKRALGLGVSCPVPWPSGPPALLLGSFCLYTKFCLEVLSPLVGQEGTEGHWSPPAQAPEEEGRCWRKLQVQTHAEESSLPRAGGAGRPPRGPVRTGRRCAAKSTGAACLHSNTFNAALGEGLTRDSGWAVGCEHSCLAGGRMVPTGAGGTLLFLLPAGVKPPGPWP